MSVYLLEVIESIRQRLDDFGGDTTSPSQGYYARWQETDTGCLWKNVELTRYLQRALRDLSARVPLHEEPLSTDLIGDVYRLSVSVGQYEVETLAPTETITQIRLLSTGTLLEKTTSARLSAEAGQGDWTTLTGTPVQYFEPRTGWIRLYPIPTAADTLRVSVSRGFLDDFAWSHVASVEDADAVELVGVPDALEEALICAVCRLAYLKRDADTFNLQLSQEYERQVTALVGPPVSFRQREARRHNANLAVAIRPFAYCNHLSSEEDDE